MLILHYVHPVILSFRPADAFAAALAKERKTELVIGDPEFKPLEKEIRIIWLKQRHPQRRDTVAPLKGEKSRW